jgi:hypothetical protein
VKAKAFEMAKIPKSCLFKGDSLFALLSLFSLGVSTP